MKSLDRVSAVAGLAFFVSACSFDVHADGGSADMLGTAAEALTSGPVTVDSSAHWFHTATSGGGFTFQADKFSVDLLVANDAYDKRVGIRYTVDGWSTWQELEASYVLREKSGKERWRLVSPSAVNVEALCSSSARFAAFATMNGQTYWDPENNYRFCDYDDTELDTTTISVDGSGGWDGYWTCAAGVCGGQYAGYWVDARVRNDSPTKKVIVETSEPDWLGSGYSASRWQYASYELGLGSNYERWGIDRIDDGNIGPAPCDTDFRLLRQIGDQFKATGYHPDTPVCD